MQRKVKDCAHHFDVYLRYPRPYHTRNLDQNIGKHVDPYCVQYTTLNTINISSDGLRHFRFSAGLGTYTLNPLKRHPCQADDVCIIIAQTWVSIRVQNVFSSLGPD